MYALFFIYYPIMMFEKLYRLFLLVSLLLLYACDNKEQIVISLEGEGGEYSVDSELCEIFLKEFIANDTWYCYIKYRDGSDWLHLSGTEGSTGKFALKVTVTSNESANPRSAVIAIKSGMYKIEYHIFQAGKETTPEKPLEPIDPEKPVDPDPIEPGEEPEKNKFAFVYKIIVSKYNDLFQLIDEKTYDFAYKDSKIESVTEAGKNGYKTVNAVYLSDKLIITDGFSKESDIKAGYLQSIESLPVDYSNKGIIIGNWKISFSNNGVESVANSKDKVYVTYSGNSNYINDCNIDLAALVCLSLMRDVLPKDFIYSQKLLYNFTISDPLYFQKANMGEHQYLYNYYVSNGRVVVIEEYYQPQYINNWLRRRIKIIYL